MQKKAKARTPKAAPKVAKKAAKPIGKITHFYPNISVAVVDVMATIKQGDKIKIEGHGKSFEQTVESMQIEHAQIKEAKKGQSIGLKVTQEVKEGDLIYSA